MWQVDLDKGDSKEYEIETIYDSEVYNKELEDQLPGLYYLVFWEGYPEEENIWELASTIQNLRSLVITFYKEHLEKPITISLSRDSASSIARHTVRPTTASNTKQKRGRPAEANDTS